VTQITELIGMEQDIITMQDVFELEQKGATPDGKVIAEFRPTGLRPKILDRIFQQGIPLPKEITMLFPPPPGYKPSTR
jgi:pilus assembly protein CpaF